MEPIFLVGAERSGSTLLGLMLGHHPNIAWGGQMEFLVDWLSHGEQPHSEDYCDWLSTQRVFKRSGLRADPRLALPDLLNSFLEQIRSAQDKSEIGAAIHRNFALLPQLWPGARFIHLLRDGRDVAFSCMGRGWAGNPWSAGGRWLQAEREWERLRASVREDRFVEIRYEDLVAEPDTALKHLCQFLQVEYTPMMLSYSEHSAYSAPDAGLAEQWKTRSSEREIQLAEARLRDMLVRRGYALSGLPALRISAAWQRWLSLQSWASRLRSRWRRYGAALLLVETATRRVGPEAVYQRVQNRMHAIDELRLR